MTDYAAAVLYPGDGSTTDFSFSFPYLQRAHIAVRVNGEDAEFSFVNQHTVRLAEAPSTGATVAISRITPSEPLVEFEDGELIQPSELNILASQTRYIAEEARDFARDGLRIRESDGAFDAINRPIVRVANPTNPNDVANLQTLQARIVEAQVGEDAFSGILEDIADYLAAVQALADGVAADKAAILAAQEACEDLAEEVEAGGLTGEQIDELLTTHFGTPAWKGSVGDGGVTTAGAHRYWRINVSSWNNAVHVLQEIQFREVAGVSEAHDTDHGGSGGTYFPILDDFNSPNGELWDGDLSGGRFQFQDSPADNAAGYTFPEARGVAEVYIGAAPGWEGYCPNTFTIDWSDNGTTWTTALEVSGKTNSDWLGGSIAFEMPLNPVDRSTVYDTPGTYTYAKPGTGRAVLVECWGGGGCGATGVGGGGGSYAEKLYSYGVFPSFVDVTVGAGLTVGASAGAQAGASSIEDDGTPMLTAYGGYAPASTSVGGNGGVPFGNRVNFMAQGTGGRASAIPATGGVDIGGGGGHSSLSGAGDSVNGGGGGAAAGTGGKSVSGGAGGNPGGAGTQPGGGGGSGGNGAHGRVRITVW